jgi:uncharacterized protein YaiE (UPF0345 family)
MNRNPMKISSALEIITPESFKGPSIDIGSKKAARIEKAAGKSLRCVSGALWVTEAGDPVDHVLEAGQSFTIGANANVVVSAFRDSRYALA